MRIVETRQNQLALRIDYLCAAAGEFFDLLCRTDGDDAIAMNGDRFGCWLIAIHRVNFRVHDDQVGDKRKVFRRAK